MSDNDDIASLIKELEALRVREARIIDLLKAANQRNRARVDTDANANVSDFLRSFEIGDRVIIRNNVRKPSGWSNDVVWDEQQARRATVTKVDAAADRVYFTTDNGVRTWRMPANLRRSQE